MNNYMKAQINQITTTAKLFKDACRIAAIKDDGRIDKKEAKELKKLEAATDKFIKEINSIK